MNQEYKDPNAENIENEERGNEEEIEKPLWMRIFLGGGRIAVTVVLIVAVFYIYGGAREFFLYRETPEGLDQAPTERKLDAEVLTLPLRIFVFRNETEGSKRDKKNIESLVESASVVWNQAALRFEIQDIIEVEASGSDINIFLNYPGEFIRSMDGWSSDAISVIFMRRLAGINGIAFSGLNIVAVADLTTVYDFRALAHEVGHILGLAHTTPDKGRLMYQGANGFKLSLEEVQSARKKAEYLWDN